MIRMRNMEKHFGGLLPRYCRAKLTFLPQSYKIQSAK